MAIALKDKLRSMQSNIKVVEPEKEPSANTETAPATDYDALASFEQQLNSIYSELEYMNQKFPNHTVQSLTDYALSLQSRISDLQSKLVNSSEEPSDHGIIPGAILMSLANLDQATADQADVGIVEVDDSGVIKQYNKYEMDLAGVQRENAIGKNFFLELAPCTNNRLFLGRFKQGVQSGNLDSSFNYTFTYKMKPTPVSIHLYRDEASNRNFVFVKKR